MKDDSQGPNLKSRTLEYQILGILLGWLHDLNSRPMVDSQLRGLVQVLGAKVNTISEHLQKTCDVVVRLDLKASIIRRYFCVLNMLELFASIMMWPLSREMW